MVSIDIIMVFIFLYYITVASARKWYIIIYVVYKIFESIALTAFGLREIVSEFVTIQIANTLYFLSIFLHMTSVTSFSGKFNKKFTLLLGAMTLISIIVFLSFLEEDRIRVAISSFTIAIIFLTGGVYLYKNRQNYKLPILLATGFIFYAFINVARGISVLNSAAGYRFYSLGTWDTILVLSAIATILISSVGFLLLLKEVDENTIFKQNRITSIAFNESPVSIVLTDTQGNIEFVNPKFSELTGYTFEEAKGKNTNILRTSRTPRQTFESLWETIQAGKTWSGEFINKKKNGEKYFEEAVIAPIKNAKQEIINYLAIKIDITQRKANEQLLEVRNAELTEINHTKDRLFSIIGHDLKGPIGNLKQLLEFINQDIERGDKESVQQIVKMSRETAETSFDFLENLLNWSRSQLNVIEPNPELFNITDLIKEVCQLNQSQVQQKKIELICEISKPIEVLADRDMISAVLRNLLSNSIKFTPIYGTIQIEVEEKSKEALLAIKDSGVGIEKDRQEKIFSFTDNESTRGTAGEKGTGLGLVLAKEFVLKNHGKIWVESEPDEGCTFFVSLPK